MESAGKKLNEARLKKNLSIQEVAHHTRMRPDRITDLENDNYSNFPNLAYARSFLVLYAKYLGVDISEFSGSFANLSRIGIADYEYLNNAAANNPGPASSRRRTERSRLPWVFLLSVLALGLLGFYAVVTFQRLGNDFATDEKEADKAFVPSPTPVPMAGIEAPTPAPTPAEPTPEPTPEPIPADSPAEMPAEAVTEPAAALPTEMVPEEMTEVRRAEPVTASDAVEPTPTPAPVLHKVTVKALKKTRVVVRRDGPEGELLHEGTLSSKSAALSFEAPKLWLRLENPSAVKVSKNGEAVKATSNLVIE